jgi:hypothetical protein
MILNNFCPGSRSVYEITWKNVVDADRPQKEIWRLCNECWVTKDTETHTHTHTLKIRIILIAFPRQ